MKNLSASVRLLTLAALSFTLSCTSDSPTPSTDLTTLPGKYGTNGAVDFSCAFISNPKDMPVLDISKQPDGRYRLVRTDFVPVRKTSELNDVMVRVQADTTFVLHDGKQIGKLFMGTWRDFSQKNSPEIAAPMLWVIKRDSVANTFFSFIGFRE